MGLDRVIAVRNTRTIYKDGNKCIKVFSKAYTKSQVMEEAMNHAIIEETQIDVPKLLEVSYEKDKYSIVTEYIKGDTLSVLMERNTDRFSEYLTSFIELQMKVFKQESVLLVSQQEKLLRRIEKCNLDATTRYTLKEMLMTMERKNNLCHGDFNPTNIISSQRGVLYLFDWYEACLGDPAADAARTYLWFSFRKGIVVANTYLDMFCKMTDTAKQHIMKWIPLVAAAQSTATSEDERLFLLNHIKMDI